MTQANGEEKVGKRNIRVWEESKSREWDEAKNMVLILPSFGTVSTQGS